LGGACTERLNAALDLIAFCSLSDGKCATLANWTRPLASVRF
jgi:hypothetical protein